MSQKERKKHHMQKKQYVCSSLVKILWFGNFRELLPSTKKNESENKTELIQKHLYFYNFFEDDDDDYSDIEVVQQPRASIANTHKSPKKPSASVANTYKSPMRPLAAVANTYKSPTKLIASIANTDKNPVSSTISTPLSKETKLFTFRQAQW